MKKTHKTKNITCRIVSKGIIMQVNTIDEILSPGQYKIDACGVTASDGFPDGVDGECLSAYLEVSDTNHSADNLKSAAVGQTLTYTDADGDTAVYHRSGTNKDGKVEWSAWSDTAALGLQDGSITADKLSKDIRTKIESPLRPLFIAAGAEYNDSGADKTKTAPWGETVIHKAGHYYLNGLGDITEEQMMEIYNYRDLVFSLDCSRVAQQLPVRTFYSAYIRSGTIAQLLDRRKLQGYSSFHSCSNLEVLWFTKSTRGLESVSLDLLPATNILSATFSDCSSLKIIGGINCLEVSSFNETFKGCSSLVEVRLYKIGKNVSFENSANISKSSILYIVQYAVPTSAITILLHSFTYARLAGDTDIVAALEAQPLVNIVCA